MHSATLALRRKQGECHACQDLEATMHEPYGSRLYGLYEAEHDTFLLRCLKALAAA